MISLTESSVLSEKTLDNKFSLKNIEDFVENKILDNYQKQISSTDDDLDEINYSEETEQNESNFMSELTSIRKDLKLHIQTFVLLEKRLSLLGKSYEKHKKEIKNKKVKKERGLNKPYNLSEELCIFLNIKKNEKKSRAQIVKLINNYITKYKLKEGAEKRCFLTDETLSNLFNKEINSNIDYFGELPNLISKHIKYDD